MGAFSERLGLTELGVERVDWSFLASLDWPFVSAMIALCFVGAALRKPRMAGTASVLLVNWTACTAAAMLLDDPYPWPWFFAFDYLSAVAILILFGWPTVWQALVIIIYAFEIVCHAARGLKGFGTDRTVLVANYYGWYLLHYAAWAQVIVVGIWGIYALADRCRLFARGPSSVRNRDISAIDRHE